MKTHKNMDFFSEAVLTVLVSIVTLLLQTISFATTWSGSKVYMEGVFPYASLLFAISIQATVYFFSNSLRSKVSALKVTAMLVAMCCSTYYSYIGIYNSVNSPVKFLEERYVQIEEEISGRYDTALQENLGRVRETLSDASSAVTATYSRLLGEMENIEACYSALEQEGKTYVNGMRAPKQSDYENYEDYVAAYHAYVAGRAEGSNAEKEAVRQGILSTYGYESMEALQSAKVNHETALNGIMTALGINSQQEEITVQEVVLELGSKLSVAVENAGMGVAFSEADKSRLNTLLQAGRACGYDKVSVGELNRLIERLAETTKEPLMRSYRELVGALEEGMVTSANTMSLKSTMDAEILSALLKTNSLLSKEEQLALSERQFQITDLYLVPVHALRDSTTRMTAFFCLFVAALIDLLSLLFALSLRKRKPLWKRRSLTLAGMDDFVPLIYASLPAVSGVEQALSEFLSCFMPCPETESEGYMMCAELVKVREYYALVALLCQVNLAKVVPETLMKTEGEEERECLLLKARFVFWANSVIGQGNGQERKVLST